MSITEDLTSVAPDEIDPRSLYRRIRDELASQFIYSEEIARVLALAIRSNRNVMFYGPAGHGKSEMVEAALKLVAKQEDIYIRSFGPGLEEAELWGGLDLLALDSEKRFRYFPEDSFLAKPYAIFEELFDGPHNVLLALRDTLTANELRKGTIYPMQTKVIVALTNHDPSEISNKGPSAVALLERFPLRRKVAWKSYTADDYRKLYARVAPSKVQGFDLNRFDSVLADLLAMVGQKRGTPVSPREAVYALEVIKAAADLRGSNRAALADLDDLRFLGSIEEDPELSNLENLRREIKQAHDRSGLVSDLERAEATYEGLLTRLEDATRDRDVAELLDIYAQLRQCGLEFAKLPVNDALYGHKKRLLAEVTNSVEEVQQLLLARNDLQ